MGREIRDNNRVGLPSQLTRNVMQRNKNQMIVIAETERLNIVSIDNNDADLLYQLTSNAEVMKFFPKIFSVFRFSLCIVL
jgi:hypothetical protein